jgi:hypothetical protein
MEFAAAPASLTPFVTFSLNETRNFPIEREWIGPLESDKRQAQITVTRYMDIHTAPAARVSTSTHSWRGRLS